MLGLALALALSVVSELLLLLLLLLAVDPLGVRVLVSNLGRRRAATLGGGLPLGLPRRLTLAALGERRMALGLLLVWLAVAVEAPPRSCWGGLDDDDEDDALLASPLPPSVMLPVMLPVMPLLDRRLPPPAALALLVPAAAAAAAPPVPPLAPLANTDAEAPRCWRMWPRRGRGLGAMGGFL